MTDANTSRRILLDKFTTNRALKKAPMDELKLIPPALTIDSAPRMRDTADLALGRSTGMSQDTRLGADRLQRAPQKTAVQRNEETTTAFNSASLVMSKRVNK